MLFGRTIVHVWPDYVRTVLPDGQVVHAVPHETDSYKAQARELGYGDDTARMMREHEVVHSALAHFIGLQQSPVMAASCRGAVPTPLTCLEEQAVLAVQAFAMAAGADLLPALLGDSRNA